MLKRKREYKIAFLFIYLFLIYIYDFYKITLLISYFYKSLINFILYKYYKI